MTTLVNTFHGTSARTVYSEAHLEHIQTTHPAEWTDNERALVRRIRRKLCGIAGCTCGGTFGERGRADGAA